jgi:hypothetical protein
MFSSVISFVEFMSLGSWIDDIAMKINDPEYLHE